MRVLMLYVFLLYPQYANSPVCIHPIPAFHRARLAKRKGLNHTYLLISCKTVPPFPNLEIYDFNQTMNKIQI